MLCVAFIFLPLPSPPLSAASVQCTGAGSSCKGSGLCNGPAAGCCRPGQRVLHRQGLQGNSQGTPGTQEKTCQKQVMCAQMHIHTYMHTRTFVRTCIRTCMHNNAHMCTRGSVFGREVVGEEDRQLTFVMMLLVNRVFSILNLLFLAS